MLYLISIFIFIFICILIYLILLAINKKNIQMDDRLSSLEDINDERFIELGESLSSVFIKKFGKILMKISPKSKSKKHYEMLEKSGVLHNISPEKWIVRKFIITVFIAIILGVVTINLSKNILSGILLTTLTVLLINAIYKFYLAKQITKRDIEIIRSLPFTLDLITVSVEAGLSLDGAIAKIVNSISGPLSEEFGKTLKEIRMGINKKDALKNMSVRVGIKDLSMLLSSLIQADELGVSLGKILRIEGAQLREKRKQAAREKAMKAPVKMLFPLILFIFPTVFVIILGPAIIKIMEVF